MGKFEIDFGNINRKREAESAKKVVTGLVAAAMMQLFVLCICVLIVLFLTNKFTLFLLSLMTLVFAVILLAVYTSSKNYKSKLKATEDEV